MRLPTNDRELICLLIAMNSSKAETSHSGRKRKLRAFEQLGLERLEVLAMPGGDRASLPPGQYPTDEVWVDIEDGTKDYLIDRLGAEGEVLGGAVVERHVCRFVNKLHAAL